MFTIGVDVGGTYTDLVATDASGRTIFAKSPSTPADQSIGVMTGLDELARRLNVSRAEMLAATDRLVHGTTVATNALLERKGARVALLTTEGHRDVIEMREGLKPDRYDLRSPPPEPLVPQPAPNRHMAIVTSATRRVCLTVFMGWTPLGVVS